MKAFPDAKDVKVRSAGTSLLVTGSMTSAADVAHAEEILRGYVSDAQQIVNMLSVPGDNQVQLEVSFAEVSRTALKEIGINFWQKSNTGDYSGGLLGPANGLNGVIPQLGASAGSDTLSLAGGLPIVQTPLAGTFGAVFSTAAGGSFPFSAALSVLSERGYARTLSEPTLTALSGQPATFLAGGEFPIPMPQALGQIGVEYKKFGVQLGFVPTVVGQNIQLKLAATVSDIDFSLGLRLASVTVPGLTERPSARRRELRDRRSARRQGAVDRGQGPGARRHPDPGDALPLHELPAPGDRAARGRDRAPGAAERRASDDAR
jgi:pilus assembly protein CpaC